MLVSEDATWAITSAMYWSVIEINVGILAASIPSFKSIARRYCPQLLGSSYEQNYDPNREPEPERNRDSGTTAASSRSSWGWGLRKFREQVGRSSGSGSRTRSNITSDRETDEETTGSSTDQVRDVAGGRENVRRSRTLTLAAIQVMAAAGYSSQHCGTAGTENRSDEALHPQVEAK